MAWRIRVPASIANLGPGFDILAMAVDLENEVVVRPSTNGDITLQTDEGVESGAAGDNLMVRAFWAAHQKLEPAHIMGAEFHCSNRIPMGKGLGSSAAAIVAGIVAAHVIHSDGIGQAEIATQMADPASATSADTTCHDVDQAAILSLATAIEGHPDNVSAALLGGLVICASGADAQRLDVSEDLCCVVFVPESVSATVESRMSVPNSFSRADAVFNAGHVGLLVRALALNDPGSLAEAMQDRWHEPFRKRYFPGFDEILQAAQRAGAYGTSLSGAGPALLALCSKETNESVARAMSDAAARVPVAGSILRTAPRNRGLTVERLSE